MKCKNTAYDHECHSVYARKYDGFCLVCSNARVPELLAERDRYKNLYEALQQTTKEALLHSEQERDRLVKAYGILKTELQDRCDVNWDEDDANCIRVILDRADAVRKGGGT